MTSTPIRTPSEASTAHTRRVAHLAHAFVMFSLIALLVVPVMLFQRTEALREDIRMTARPAISLIDDVEIALAGEVSAIRGWLLTNDDSFRGHFYSAKSDLDEAFAELDPLIEQLGPAAGSAFRELRLAEREWLMPNLNALDGDMVLSDLERQIPMQQQRYVVAIEAAKELARAVSHVVEQRQESIRSATRLSMYVTALLSVFAILSMVIILWNAYRWRFLVSQLEGLVHERGEQAARARAAVRTRDEVLAIVSHDLRSPLTAIAVSAANLRSQVATSFHRRHLDIITRSVDRTNRLICDILDVTRIESGQKLSIEPGFLDIVPIVESLVESFKPQAEKRLQEIECVIESDLSPLYADHDRLQQVLSNLVGNAIKFTPEGGRVYLQIRETIEGTEFSVADTGPGIAESDVEHIFDPYWQVERTARLGTGLGLTIAKGIVDGHGGRLWVESTPGEGTTFTFTLPKSTCKRVEMVTS